MVSETCLLKWAMSMGMVDVWFSFRDSNIGGFVRLLNACNRKSTNRTKSSTNRMVGRIRSGF